VDLSNSRGKRIFGPKREAVTGGEYLELGEK
jgi:hypothetical protein